MRMRASRFLRAAMLLVACLVVLAFGLLAARFTGIAEPGISQDRYHRIGTMSDTADFSATVRQRPVIVEPPERSAGEILGEYVRRVRERRPLGGVQGEYDLETDEIRILGDEVRLQSRLPEQLRGELYHVVRHEYGHAAFFDWLARQGLDDVTSAQVGMHQRGAGDVPPGLPEPLVAVVEEWNEGPDDVYLDPYLTSNLAEYTAESYARVLDGATVPPAAEAFVREAYGAR